MKADDVRPLLPALVHLARFPTCNLRVICERWGVDKARVMQAVADAEGGEMAAGAFDEELLQRAAKRWKLSLPAWQAVPPTINKAALAAAARKPDKRPRVGVRVAVREPSPVTDQERGRPRRKDDLYLAVCNELLLGGGRLSEGEACARHGLHGSTWIYFKKQRLGLGALDPNKLHAVACELSKQLGMDKTPGLPEKWAVAPHPVARANYAKNAGETAPFGAKSAVLAEIAGKERRHLVASILVGLLVRPSAPTTKAEAVADAYGYYDELVKWDRAREGGCSVSIHNRVRIFAEAPCYGFGGHVNFYLRETREIDGVPSVSYAQPFTFVTRRREDEGMAAMPAFTLPREAAQQLMDELWQIGLRPSEGSGSAGALAATQRHLDDMRALVFKTGAPGGGK